MFKRKRIILGVILGLFLLVLVPPYFFFRDQYVAPVLMYHSVDHQSDVKNKLAVRAETFRRQMKFLRDRQYNVIPLEELAALFREKKKIPPRTVILTFDDGYKDFYTFAYPVLKEYRLPAVMFIITEEAGRAQNDRLSWDEIKEMQRSGLITFGSHCIGPEPLINIKSEQEVKRQIFDSKRILEEKLGVKVNTFSYPEGMFTPKIRQTVIDAGYACAVATQPGIDYPDNDVFAMKRIRISEKSRNLFIFAYKLSGYYTHIREYQKERKRKRNAERQAYPDF